MARHAVDMRAVEALIPYFRNAHTHREKQTEQIAASMERFLLQRFRQRVQHVHCLVDPTALFPRGREDLAQRGPEPKGAVADGQFGILFQAPAPEIQQEFAPAFRAFAEAVGHRQELLTAIFIGPHDHQNALLFFSHARFEIDAIGSDVEEAPMAQVPFLPSLAVVPSVGLQPRDRLCGSVRCGCNIGGIGHGWSPWIVAWFSLRFGG